ECDKYPSFIHRIESEATLHEVCLINPPPDNNVYARPHCRVITSGFERVGSASSCPAVRAGIVPTASLHVVWTETSQDDHLTAGPDRSMSCSAIGWARGGAPSIFGASATQY